VSNIIIRQCVVLQLGICQLGFLQFVVLHLCIIQLGVRHHNVAPVEKVVAFNVNLRWVNMYLCTYMWMPEVDFQQVQITGRKYECRYIRNFLLISKMCATMRHTQVQNFIPGFRNTYPGVRSLFFRRFSPIVSAKIGIFLAPMFVMTMVLNMRLYFERKATIFLQ
jgi:hypothetical protein